MNGKPIYRQNVCDETTYFLKVLKKQFNGWGSLNLFFSTTESCKRHLPFVKLSDWPSHGLAPTERKSDHEMAVVFSHTEHSEGLICYFCLIRHLSFG